MVTRAGEIYRYRGSIHTAGNYWTIYHQLADGMFFSGSSNREHLNSVGATFNRNSSPGQRKGSRWERLV